MAEAFVKTFKRDYVRVNPIPDATSALAAITDWMDNYNEFHPHIRLGCRSSREYPRAYPLHVRFNGEHFTLLSFADMRCATRVFQSSAVPSALDAKRSFISHTPSQTIIGQFMTDA